MNTNNHDFEHITAGRKLAQREQEVAIYTVTKRPRKTPTSYAPASKVAETIARLERLNPGYKFETR